MSACTASSPPDSDPQIVGANDPRVDYEGVWTTGYDSQQGKYQVSTLIGDKATFVFEGVFIQAIGRINSQGKALFGLDVDGSQNGGVTCQNPPGPQPDSPKSVLYGTMFPPGQHTLFVKNTGGQLSLSAFKVFGGSEMPSTSTSHSPKATATQASINSPQISSSNSSPLTISTSSTVSPMAGSNLPTIPSSSVLDLPSPIPSAVGPSISASISPIPSDFPATTQSAVRGSSSYTISSYTEVSIMDGSTTTIVVQTTIEALQTQPYSGLSRGAVAGAVIGGLLFLLVLVGLGLWWWRRRRNRVRFLYGISNLDFDPDMMMRSDAELPTPRLEAAVRDSDGTLYDGDTLPPYKRPASYLSFASDLKKHPPSERAVSAVAGDRRPSTDERNTGSLPEERSLHDSFSGPGRESVGSVVLTSEKHHEAL